MYHSISEDILRNSHPYFDINTPPALFESHMRYLRNHGYSTIGFRELEGAAAAQSEIKNPVVITFDDGYADFHRKAYPILETYGFRAVVFLVTGFIGKGPSGRMHGKEMLRWEEVRALRKSGTVFGAHTVNHPVLRNLEREEMESELLQSKKQIEDQLDESIDVFSCPFAFPQEDKAFQSAYISSLKLAGYRYGVTTVIGRFSFGDDILRMRRLPVNRHDDLALFKAKLEGGYDWIRGVQYTYRAVKIWM